MELSGTFPGREDVQLTHKEHTGFRGKELPSKGKSKLKGTGLLERMTPL